MSHNNVDIFNPVPEAKAFDWKSLCPSTQKALEKIFFWLDAACNANQHVKNDEQEELASKYQSPSTSILLSGDRGSGKTTVLLSAAFAYKLAAEQKGNFFKGTDNQEANDIKILLNATCHKVYWLDALDLEPLHPDTNLLSSILVRIRLAIENMDYELNAYQPTRRRSILEGDLGTGEKLNRLINDATFMWEAIPVNSGPRLERSEQQIKAAEISARFQQDFKEVMEQTTRLVRNRGRQQTELFVLPIDNVDRSIEHIASISKLIRLATSQRLWFILAAVRPDYQLFLERSFQKELLRSGTSSNASNWDQTQAIARRQAATSMRRSLPENYQIQIEPLPSYQAWTFPHYQEKANQKKNTNQFKEEKCSTNQSDNTKISSSDSADNHNTLKKLCISLLESDKTKEHCNDNLSCGKCIVKTEDLAIIKSKIESGNMEGLVDLLKRCVNPSSSNYAEDTGKLTDICELIMQSNKDKELNILLGNISLPSEIKGMRFHKLADLFNITSQLDSEAQKEYLNATRSLRNHNEEQNKDIFTGSGKMALGLSMRTLLDLKAAIALFKNETDGAIEVSVRMLRNAIDESNLPFWASKLLLDQIIRKNSNDKWVLDLTNDPIRQFETQQPFYELSYPVNPNARISDPYIEDIFQYQEIPEIVLEIHDIGNKDNKIPLPPVIAGWFMILHDILILREKPHVLCKTSLPNKAFSSGVKCIHKLIFNQKRDVELQFEWKTPLWPTFAEHFLFAAQWTAIFNKLKYHFDNQIKELYKTPGFPSIDIRKENTENTSRILHLAWIDNICSVTGKGVDKWEWYKLETLTDCIKDTDKYAENIRLKLCKLIQWSLEDKFDPRKIVTWNWLSKGLSLFLKPEYSLLLDQNGDPGYKVLEIWPEEMRKEIKWPDDEIELPPSKYWQYLNNYWEEHHIRLRASRTEIVHSAIVNSEAFKTCVDPGKFINDNIEDWHSSIEKSVF